MKKHLLVSLMLVSFLVLEIFTSQSKAADFHVTNAAEFQNALATSKSNGEDDTIYLASGTYAGSFGYHPSETEHRSLTVQGEPGTTAQDVILDGQNSDGVLSLYDDDSSGTLVDINIRGITMQNGLGHGGASGLRTRFYRDSNISIVDCIIKNSSGPGYGAGIVIEVYAGSGNISLENNLILNNIVTEYYNEYSYGGGVAVLYDGGGQVTIRNNIIAKNSTSGTAAPHGGGLCIGAENAIVHLIGNTIYNNQANKGGGVYFFSTNAANIYNNIIYGNTATDGGDIYFESDTNGIAHNNNYSNIYGTWTDSGSNLNANPLFVDPTNNDFHLQPNSLMINAGTMAVSIPPGLPATDFEGNPRVYGITPDIGAYEFQGSPFPIFPPEGTIGTEITITGSGYGSKKGKVLIEKVALTVREWTDELIRCELLKTLLPGTYDVTIRPSAKGALPITIEDGFTVKGPEIELIEPTSGSVGDTIPINGLFFGTKKGKVTLGGKSCKVTSWTMDKTTGEGEIKFVVPKGVTSGTKELKVTNGVGSDTLNFTVE